jgi:hypothetical protein
LLGPPSMGGMGNIMQSLWIVCYLQSSIISYHALINV